MNSARATPADCPRVLIIGLGRIGAGYDLERDPTRFVLSHARAFQQHPGFILAGGADPDATRRAEFSRNYGCPAFADPVEALRTLQPQVVVIATPTPHHLESVRTVLAHSQPAALLCEKPLAFTFAECREIVDLCAHRDCRLFVNYMRRTDPTVRELHERLASGAILGPVKGVAWYAKGLFNSASHQVNLMEHLLGEVRSVRLLQRGTARDDGDPEPDFALEFARGAMTFLAVRDENFFHHAFEWIAANGRLRYEQGGATVLWQGTAPSSTYAMSIQLAPETVRLPGDFDRVQWHVADALNGALAGRASPICTGEQAWQTLRTLAQITESS